MESTSKKEVKVTFLNPSDIKKISNEGITLKRKYGNFERKTYEFDAIDKTEKSNSK